MNYLENSRDLVVINVVHGEPVVAHHRDNYMAALNLAVQIAMEQLSEDSFTTADMVREELKEDNNWYDSTEDAKVYIMSLERPH